MTSPAAGTAADVLDVVIVGGGPAGLTAATYLRRFHRSCLLLDAGNSRARWIPESNNCPGFPQGISGVELLRRMHEQAAVFETRIESATVDSIEKDGDCFAVSAGSSRWRARCVVLATGLTDKLPEAPWVERAVASHALRLCSICDAYEAGDTRIGVYGAMDAIAAHAKFLRAYSTRVAVLPTRDGTRPAEVHELESLGIDVFPAGGTLDFDGERCSYILDTGRVETFDCIYPFLGASTSAGMVEALGVRLSETGEIRVDSQLMTEVPGLYAIGDVVSGLNQISVAVGQAAIAATAVHNRLPYVPRQAPCA